MDSAVNPYLSFAALLMAMKDGLERNLDPGPPEERNIYEAIEEGKEVERVPKTLGEALDALEADEVVQVGAARRHVPGVHALQARRVGPVHRDRERLGHRGVPRHPPVGGESRRSRSTAMCGIAGIIHRDGDGDIGSEMTRMLQSMKHRGPDSTGFALFGPPTDHVVIRFKLADANDPRDFEFRERLERHRLEVESRLDKIGAAIDRVERETEYAYRATVRYEGDLKALADYLEDVPGCEVLSLGHSLEIVKDLGDARGGLRAVQARRVRGHPRDRPRRGWRRSPTWTSPAPTRTGRTRSPTSPWCTTAS